MPDYIEGLCIDCAKCESGNGAMCCDWSENQWCEHRSDDGSCWEPLGGDGDA